MIDLASLKPKDTFARTHTVTAIALAADGRTLAIGGGKGQLSIWDTVSALPTS